MRSKTIVRQLSGVLAAACFVCGLAALITTHSTAQSATPAPAEIKWFSYDAGMAKAQKEGKHVLIDFYTNWCGWCKRMDNTTFKDAAVVGAVIKSMVAIKVNAESANLVSHNGQKVTERELSSRVYGVTGYPTYFFVDPKGERVKLPGYRGPTDFLGVVEYFGSGQYKTTSFPKFLESRKTEQKPSK